MRRTKKGIVVSIKMNKTIVIEVSNYKFDPKYKKRYKVSKSYYAHDEENKSQLGDIVEIQECRPLSKTKKWRIVCPKEDSNVEKVTTLQKGKNENNSL